MSMGLNSLIRVNKAEVYRDLEKHERWVRPMVEPVLELFNRVAAALINRKLYGIPILDLAADVAKLIEQYNVYYGYLEVLFKDQMNYNFNIFQGSFNDTLFFEQLARMYLWDLLNLRWKWLYDNECGFGGSETVEPVTIAPRVNTTLNHNNISACRQADKETQTPDVGINRRDAKLPNSDTQTPLTPTTTGYEYYTKYKKCVLLNGSLIHIGGDDLKLIENCKEILNASYSTEQLNLQTDSVKSPKPEVPLKQLDSRSSSEKPEILKEHSGGRNPGGVPLVQLKDNRSGVHPDFNKTGLDQSELNLQRPTNWNQQSETNPVGVHNNTASSDLNELNKNFEVQNLGVRGRTYFVNNRI